MTLGTAEIAPAMVAKGTSTDTAYSGLGIIFKVASHTTAKVPSEPMIRSFREKPLEFFTTLLPRVRTSPLGSTTFKARTASRVTPYLTARMPPALVEMLPPMVALFSPGSGQYR